MNNRLAAQLGRADLFNPGDGAGYASLTPTITDLQGDPATAISARVSGDFTGRLSAGMLAILTLALGGFYVWTRSYQK